MVESGGVWRSSPRRRTEQDRQGFTLVEVMFASSIALLLFLSLFETLSVCQRMAADLKWRLTADALAYDKAWEVFNYKTEWFNGYTSASSAWYVVSSDQTSVWYAGGKAYYNLSITPVGSPISNWVIRTTVKWPLPSGSYAALPQDYRVVRMRNERNLFR